MLEKANLFAELIHLIRNLTGVITFLGGRSYFGKPSKEFGVSEFNLKDSNSSSEALAKVDSFR